MPSVLFNDDSNSNGLLKQIIIGTVTAALVGVWVFASTRASSEDLNQVEIELKAVDLGIKNDLKELTNDIHEIDVEQSAFRAQVRQALSIPEPSITNR
jgi:hypothetical protein